MSGLVPGNGSLLLLFNDLVFLFESSNDAVNGIQKILLINDLLILSCSDQCRFVTYIGNICSGETGSLFGQKIHIHRFIDFDRFHMHLKYGSAFVEIG